MRYRIRRRDRDGEELLEERDVVRRIRSGRLSGEEEAAPEGTEAWRTLSAIPQFYDAFLKRLYATTYKDEEKEEAPEKKATRRVPATKHDNKTRQDDPSSSDSSSEAQNAGRGTEQIPGPAHTVRQSLLDDLFSEASAVPPPKIPEGSALIPVGTARDVLGGSAAPSLADPMASAFGNNAPVSDLSTPLSSTPAPAPKANRTRLILIGAVLLGLLWLAAGGSKTQALLKPSTNPFSEEERNALNESMPAETRALKQQTILTEGDELALQDTLLFYRGAYNSYKEALQVDGKSKLVASLQGRIATTAARLVELRAASGEELERLIAASRAAISAGRRLDPQASSFYRAEALLLSAEGKRKEARQAIYNALDTDPQNADNALVLAETQLALGEILSARTAADEASKAAPTLVRARVLTALLAAEAKDWGKARSEALAAIQLNPLHSEAYLILARASLETGKVDEARGLLESSGRLARFTKASNASQAYLLLGRLQDQSGKKAEAAVSYRLAYHYNPESAEAKEKASAYDTSADALRRLAAETEYGTDYFTSQGESLYSEGRLAEALRFYQAAVLLDPKNGAALIRLGEVAEKAANEYGDVILATTIYERALARDPTLARAYVRLGAIETDQYNWTRALQLLRQGVALAPNEAEPFVALAKYHYKRRDYNEAVTQLLEAMKHNPKNSEVHYYAGLVRLTVKKDSMRDAMVHFEDAYRNDPRNFPAMSEWLKLKALSGEKNFAIKFLNVIEQQNPKEAHIPWAMGELYGALQEQRRAVVYYHKALDLDNRLAVVRMSLGRSLESVGEQEKALAEYALASDLDRRNGDGYFKAASIEFELKRYSDAEATDRQLLARMPNYPGAQRLLSKIHEARREKDAAVAAMRKEVENNPENAKYVLELSELLMGYSMVDEAINELQKIASLPSRSKAPEYALDKTRALLLLGRCYRAQNRFESAESALQLAMKIEPNDPELHRELGYVYYSLHRDKEGVRHFQFYLDRNPAARDADTIRALMEKMQITE